MRRVRHQVMPAQMIGKDGSAGFDDLVLAHPFKAKAVPGLLAAFDDEGRGVVVELVDMRPQPAMFGAFEDEGEGVVEFLVGAQPDELAQAHVDIGLEHILIFAADLAVQPVRGNDQIVIRGIAFRAAEFGFKPHVHAQFAGAILQQGQHLLASDPGKAMPARHVAMAVADHGDIVPVDEIVADRLRRLRIVALHPFQRVIRQHDAPAEGVIGPVAFQHRDLMRGVAQLHRDREIQTRGPAAEAENLHAVPPPVQGKLARRGYYFKLEISCRSASAIKAGTSGASPIGSRRGPVKPA